MALTIRRGPYKSALGNCSGNNHSGTGKRFHGAASSTGQMDPIRDGTDGSQGTVQVGIGESWWDRSVSAWGGDDRKGDDVAVTRGGVSTWDQAAKAKAKRHKQHQKQNKARNEKQQTKKKSKNAYDEQNAVIILTHKKHLSQTNFLFVNCR